METLINTSGIIVSDNLDTLAQTQQVPRNAMLLVFCRAGKLHIEMNGQGYDMRTNELLFCLPDFLLGNYMHSDDFQCYIFSFTSDSLRDVLYSCLRLEPNWFDKFVYLREHPIVSLSSHRTDICQAYGQLFRLYMQETNDHIKRISTLLAQAIIFEMISWVDEAMREKNASPRLKEGDANGRMVLLFGQFMRLLEENHEHRYPVSWYADRLAISAKYLTYLCNQVAKRTPSAFINDIAIREIKNRLLNTNDSIKHIAIDMSFATASSFCKYFRLHTGTSPQSFRKRE